MSSAPILYAGLTLIVALIAGLLPIFSKIKENPERLKMITAIASGIIIASAMLIVIPEGYEIASSDSHEENDEVLAGSIALVFLELNHGEVNESEAIEEIESLLSHDDHGHDESHEEEEHEEETHDEEGEGLKETVAHAIEEYEEGLINATTALEEIETAISSVGHSDGEEHDEHTSGLLLGGAILGGFLLMFVLEGVGIGHAVHEEHHDHDDHHGHGHVHHSDSGWRLVLGLTLHSATDGIAIGAAAATGSITLTATVAIAVLIHRAPAAFSLGVFSMHERKERKDSIRDVVIFSLATPIMMMLAYFALSDLETHMIGLAMLFSAGTFLYVAAVDTLPDIHNPETGRTALFYVLIGAVGMVLVLTGADAAGLLEHGH